MAPQRRKSRSATDEEDPAARQGPAAGHPPPAAPDADDRADTDADDRADTDRADTDADDRADGHGRIRTAREAAKAALRQVLELTAKPPESITGVQRTEDGWSVCFEVLEDRRIPSSADILATYESVIDRDGELTSFRRIRRYGRGRGDGNGGSAR
jgi:hypothetical protein